METNYNEQKAKEVKKLDVTKIEEFLRQIIDPKKLSNVFDRIIIDYSLLLIQSGSQGNIYFDNQTSSDIYFLVQLRDICKDM